MKIKYFLAGLIAGTALMSAVPALADSDYVQAFIDRTIKLEIAGQVKSLPEGYEILNYQGRTYLPTRYVAEELGCTVNWEEASRYITISAPPVKEVVKEVQVPVEVEKVVYVQNETNYSKLPASDTNDNISITAKTIHRIVSSGQMSTTRISCEVKNNTDDGNINVDYGNATLEVDGAVYKAGDIPLSVSDQGFYDDIQKDKSYEGYISFRLIDAGTKNFVLKVPVRNQSSGKMTQLQVRFSATLEE